MWEARGSMLVNVGKCSKRASSSSRLGTSMGTTDKVCALDIESSPDMVIVSPNPWKWMFFASYTLVADGDRGISISEALAASLEDEPFSLVLFFFLRRPKFNGLAQPFMLPLKESNLQIGNHFFFFSFFNYKWHNWLDSLTPLNLLYSERFVQLGHGFLNLRSNNSLLLY